jgi:Rieske Fe-S protein
VERWSRRRFLTATASAFAAIIASACGAANSPSSQPGQAATPAVPSAQVATQDPAIAALANGQGAVVTIGGQSEAVYKDAGGAVTQLSSKCTHQGCTVAWNPTDKTWDCPCPGSRYNADGSVLNGPAQKPLPRIA